MNRPFELFRPVLFALGLAAALIAPLLIHGQVHAQATGCRAGELCIDLNPRTFKPMPIAIVDFTGDGQAPQISQIISSNLKRSGVFEPLDPARFPERSLGFDAVPNFAAWSAIGAQAIVTGRVVRDGSRMAVEYRLWDATTGKQVVGQKHAIDPASWRRLGHLASDAVYERMTGETGFFDTRVVFVDESGPKEKRKKRLAIMDQDGANFRAISSGSEMLLTPRFSPRGDRVTFMALEDAGRANVQVLELGSGRRSVVSNGAATMKITSNTSITSMKGIILRSAIGAARLERLRLPLPPPPPFIAMAIAISPQVPVRGCAGWPARSSIWRERMAENSSAKLSRRPCVRETSFTNLL